MHIANFYPLFTLPLYFAKVLKYNVLIKEIPPRKGKVIMKKFFAICLALALMLSILTGCSASDSGSDLAAIRKIGKIIVGITDYAPMDY